MGHGYTQIRTLKGMRGGGVHFGGPKCTWATVGADVLLETRYVRGGLSDKHSKSRIAHPEIHPFWDPDLAVYISTIDTLAVAQVSKPPVSLIRVICTPSRIP